MNNYRTSLAVSVLLANAAFCVITPVTAVAGEPSVKFAVHATAPTPAKTTEDAPIMDEAHLIQLMGIIDHINPGSSSTHPKLAQILGLAAPGDIRYYRQVGFNRGEVKHTFGVMISDPSVLLVARQTPQENKFYRARMDTRLKLILGVVWEAGKTDPIAMPVEEALAGFNAELKAWVDELDKP